MITPHLWHPGTFSSTVTVLLTLVIVSDKQLCLWCAFSCFKSYCSRFPQAWPTTLQFSNWQLLWMSLSQALSSANTVHPGFLVTAIWTEDNVAACPLIEILNDPGRYREKQATMSVLAQGTCYLSSVCSWNSEWRELSLSLPSKTTHGDEGSICDKNHNVTCVSLQVQDGKSGQSSQSKSETFPSVLNPPLMLFCFWGDLSNFSMVF
jgi:hypothetical protein